MPHATMRDVAARAGVSKTTVSHVLNATRFVEEETVARVQQAIHELGYRPNLLARSLRRQQTQTIALLIPDNTNMFWAELARAVEQAGYANAYTVLLCNSDWSFDRQRVYIETLLAKQIDGVILAATYPKADAFQTLVAGQVPVVSISSAPPELPISSVRIDNESGGYLAGAYLVQLGHKRVGCIGSRREFDAAKRMVGFQRALAEAGIMLPDSAFVEGDFSYASGEVQALALLGAHPDLTALFAINDNMALGAIKGLRKQDRRVPADVSVIGFDNIIYGTTTTPELTTIAQPIRQMGETAFALLLKQLQDPNTPPEAVVMQPTLIERESCQRI